MSKPPKTPRLGRGLSALLATIDVATNSHEDGVSDGRRTDQTLPVDRIVANPKQPRKTFDETTLSQLAASIRNKGIIQPLLVRPVSDSNMFEIVAGERRWRAARLAGLREVPVIVREFEDFEVLQVAVIENIQRADLNPIEEAEAYRDLMERFDHTQEQLAAGLSKSRSHIANLLRLLNLPNDVQSLVREGRLSMGHARALITAPDPSSLAMLAVEKDLSVRAVEALARRSQSSEATELTRSERAKSSHDRDMDVFRQRLSESLGMMVAVAFTKGKEQGTLKICFSSREELEFLSEVLASARREDLP